MKRFFLRIGILVVAVAFLDFVVGIIGAVLVDNAKWDNTQRQAYISNDMDAEIVIVGSSRALYHYDPDIFEDTLGMTAYNCGFDGNGIISAYGYMKMIEKRYYPKVVIYDTTPKYDVSQRDNHFFLGQLKYFYDKDGIDSIFWAVDKTERYKMISRMYRYNSALPMIILDNLYAFRKYNKGYRPLSDDKGIVPSKMNMPKMKSKPKKRKKRNNSSNDRQSTQIKKPLNLYYLERLINDCRGKTTLVIVVSPLYKNRREDVLWPIQVLCEKYGVPLISHYADSTFNDRGDYFVDLTHLNRCGATEYSKVVAGEVKRLMEQQ